MSVRCRVMPFFFAASVLAGASATVAQTTSTQGSCSPVVMDVGGDVSIVCFDSDAPKFRVAYYRVGGLGLSFLLDGLLSPEWAEHLGGQQAIITNAVSEEARAFLDQFATPVGGSFIVGDVSFKGGDYSSEFAEYAKQVDPSIETYPGETGEMPELDPELWRAYFGNGRQGELFIPDIAAGRTLFGGPEWPEGYGIIYWGRDGQAPELREDVLLGAPMMWRWMSNLDLDSFEQDYRLYASLVLQQAFPTAGAGALDVFGTESVEDVMNSGNSQQLLKSIDSIRYLAREGLPERFLVVLGEMGVHYGWTFTATPRDFQLLIAVVENISDRPIEVGDFVLRETRAMTLREHEESNYALDRVASVSRRLYPLGALRPGEKIVLPVRIELPQSDMHSDLEADLNAYARRGRDLERRIVARGRASIAVQDFDRTTMFSKPASAFPPQSVPDIIERYEYGPAWRLESIQIDGKEFAFRPHDPNNFVLIAGFGVGSCPYAFTYQPEGRFWRSEGHFLVGATTPEKKRIEEKALEHFKGRVAIREMEHEIAFLDMIRLKLVDRDGIASIYKPRQASLRDTDGEELRLSYGQEIELEFGVTERDWRNKKASLIVSGYYLPFEGSRLFTESVPH